MSTAETIAVENAHTPPFFSKLQISIARGEGVYVWDEEGEKYLDLTAGWGVTSIGHAHPVIRRALAEQSARILQNPDSGLTYSPARARLLALLAGLLPEGLTRVFFTNSGAEANDAAVKLARKVTGREGVVATVDSFHGRTISMVSATGQASHRDRFRPLMPGYSFIPFNDLEALEAALDGGTAAFIVEPIQGEGGVHVPAADYLRRAAELCHANGSLLIVDEVQTGFCRTGPMFAAGPTGARPDFLTMAKGIAGGFPAGRLRTHGGGRGQAAGRRPRRHLLRQSAGLRRGRGRDRPPRRDRRRGARGRAGSRGARGTAALECGVPGRGDRRPRRRPAAARRVLRRADRRRRRRRVPGAPPVRAPDARHRHPRVPGPHDHARRALGGLRTLEEAVAAVAG